MIAYLAMFTGSVMIKCLGREEVVSAFMLFFYSDYDSDHLQQPASAVAVAAVASKGYSYLMNNGLIPTSAASGALIGQTQMIQTDNKLYCVCQSPHDDVSEMIGCDAPDCRLEWFHFECVGIMVPPEGQWYCPECTKRYNIRATY